MSLAAKFAGPNVHLLCATADGIPGNINRRHTVHRDIGAPLVLTLSAKELVYDSEFCVNILSDLVSVESLEVASSPNDSCVAGAVLSLDCFILLQACCSNSEHTKSILAPNVTLLVSRNCQ